jgi:hypothetical protein
MFSQFFKNAVQCEEETSIDYYIIVIVIQDMPSNDWLEFKDDTAVYFYSYATVHLIDNGRKNEWTRKVINWLLILFWLFVVIQKLEAL